MTNRRLWGGEYESDPHHDKVNPVKGDMSLLLGVEGKESITANVRVMAATNQNLDAMVASGLFCRDLFIRRRGVTVSFLPLRDRKTGISELARSNLFRFGR